MSIVSIYYFLFLLVAAAVYYLVPMRHRWVVLLVASCLFFAQNASAMLLLVTAAMVSVAYRTGCKLQRIKDALANAKEGAETAALAHKAKAATTRAIVLEAAALILLQDNAFFAIGTNGMASLLHADFSLPVPLWVAQFGVSYFALMLMGYVLDVYWGISPAQQNPAKLVLFTLFFPQLVSGPITRVRQVQDNLFLGNTFSHQNIAFGTQRILWGLFKKLVVAERLAVVVGTVVGDFRVYPGSYVMLAVFGYALQLYADFSASMDLALGAAQLFGVALPENFRNPFFSQSLSEWWRNWHITLGLWVKDYILYPTLKSAPMRNIGGYCKAKYGKAAGRAAPVYLGMFVTWCAVGFWHGGTFAYLIGTGLAFFVMIAGGMLLQPFFRTLVQRCGINTNCFSWRLFCAGRTFVLFSCAIFMGRVGSVVLYCKMLVHALLFFGGLQLFSIAQLSLLGLDQLDINVLVGALVLMLSVECLQLHGGIRARIARQNICFRWLVWLALFFAVVILGVYGPGYQAADFIYGGF